MKQRISFYSIATILCCTVTLLFFVLFTYFFFSENIAVSSSRHAHSYGSITDYTIEKLETPKSPTGIQNVYQFTLKNLDTSESCLCFYVAHQYAHVYLDDQLIYELGARDSNRIGKTISSNWVTVPIHKEDIGKEISIVLTPLFDNMIDFEPEFLLGSHFSIVLDLLKNDLVQLFLSLLCIILATFILAIQMYFIIHTSNKKWDMVYLAGFALLLGIWRLTDMKSSPILFSQNPMALGYISIGSLFLLNIFLQLYISTFFSKKRAFPLLTLSIISSLITLFAGFLQVMAIADFKEILIVCHVMLLVSVVCLCIAALFSKKSAVEHSPSKNRRLFLILAVGIALDIFKYYGHESSSHVFYTVIAFVIYTLIVFVTSILETVKKAHIDSPTGLLNKSRWNDLLKSIDLEEENIGITMIDLNGLKHINDTRGHEVGDQMISDFSKLLQSSFSSSCILCRWGGDEFVITTTKKDTEKLNEYISLLHYSVTKHNADNPDLPLSYAIGHCLSSEHPTADYMELLKIADEQMYANKKGKE